MLSLHQQIIITEAVDKTRRQERGEYPELKGMRYALLRNEETMTDKQLEFVSSLLLRKTKMKTARHSISNWRSTIYTPPLRRALPVTI